MLTVQRCHPTLPGQNPLPTTCHPLPPKERRGSLAALPLCRRL